MGKLILNKTLTEKISKDLKEEIISADFVDSSKPDSNVAYRRFCYIVNAKWRVNVYLGINTNKNDYWNIRSLAEIEKQRKEYEETITRIAIKAGVPLNIAKLVSLIKDEESIVELFKHIKSCRGFEDENLKNELKSSNIHAVEPAIIKVIGVEAWNNVKRNKKDSIFELAEYLCE